MDVIDIIRKWAVRNRLQYGQAKRESVLGKVLSENPEAKKDIKSVLGLIDSIVAEINSLPIEELKKQDFEVQKRSKDSSLRLPDNPKTPIMRFAPNPNGPPTLGSARGIVVNSELARRYGGRFILRFDDTDPKTKKPMLEAYDWYLEDCEWLDAKPDEVYYASDRIDKYYEYAKKLISLGYAYVCFCPQQEFKALKDQKLGCIHRKTPAEENLKLWDNMLGGRYSDGECVLRIKTDIKHRDPALRDWVAFRIIREKHPRVGEKYIVWPMLDFESAIEDHLLNVTHIIRGKDLADSEHRQRFIYDYFGWRYPLTLHWGKVCIQEFGKLSTSKLKESIARGEYSGWDDPRLPTIRAMRRRGILPQAIRNLMIGLGLSEVDVSISLENLFAENRRLLDSSANRFFFVEDPIELIVYGAPEKTARIPLHPSFRDRGFRELKVVSDGEAVRLFISSRDVPLLSVGKRIRLMNLFNVRIDEIKEKCVLSTYLPEESRDLLKIQWIQDHLDAELVTSEGLLKGFCEPGCDRVNIGEVVQFERVGFARLDRKQPLVFYFTHR